MNSHCLTKKTRSECQAAYTVIEGEFSGFKELEKKKKISMARLHSLKGSKGEG